MPKKKANETPKSKKKKPSKKQKTECPPMTLVLCNIQIYGADGEILKELVGNFETAKISQSDVPNNMLALLSALRASTSGAS